MKIKGLLDEDFINYKKPSMFIQFPYCTFKCDKEAKCNVCQNSALANAPIIEIDTEKIVERYKNNPITSAVVCGGLEPMDSGEELLEFISRLRATNLDDIVIYTGYTKNELCCNYTYQQIVRFSNIVFKFGRFIPNCDSRFDEVLGVTLASNNQYAERVS